MVRIEEPDRDTYHHHYHNQGFDEDEAVQHAKVSAPKMNASWFGRPIEEVDHLVFDDVRQTAGKFSFFFKVLF